MLPTDFRERLETLRKAALESAEHLCAEMNSWFARADGLLSIPLGAKDARVIRTCVETLGKAITELNEKKLDDEGRMYLIMALTAAVQLSRFVHPNEFGERMISESAGHATAMLKERASHADKIICRRAAEYLAGRTKHTCDSDIARAVRKKEPNLINTRGKKFTFETMVKRVTKLGKAGLIPGYAQRSWKSARISN